MSREARKGKLGCGGLTGPPVAGLRAGTRKAVKGCDDEQEMPMRLVLAAAALAAFALPALAQGQPARPPAGQRPPAAQQQPQPPEPPPIFLCRTAEEVCTLGIVTGNNQIVVIFTNAPGAEGVAKPIDVSSGDGSPLDLSQNMGRVVLLTGAYDPKTGLTKAELVEAASPLVSTLIKAQVAGGGDEGAPSRGGKPSAQRKR
jgi:hypothetical protein